MLAKLICAAAFALALVASAQAEEGGTSGSANATGGQAGSASTRALESRAAFCNRWNATCRAGCVNHPLKSKVGKLDPVQACIKYECDGRRMAECMATGCYPFKFQPNECMGS